MLHRRISSPKCDPIPKHVLQAKLSAAWARVISTLDGGKHAFAQALSVSTPTIENALAGKNVPEALTLLNSLTIDDTALDEPLREMGFMICRINRDNGADIQTAAGVVTAMGDMIQRYADGIRCHNDTLAIAALLRPHMAGLEGIICEADRLMAGAG
jgi:hypothetical protein